MALQFDMSKNNWQQDLMLQEQMRELGQSLGDAGVAVGGALGKALLPEGGKNLPNWFKVGKGDFDKEAYEADSQKWKEEKAKLTGEINWGEYPGMYDNEQDKLRVLFKEGLRHAPRERDFMKEGTKFKFTPGKGIENIGKTLFPNEGKNVGKNVAIAAGTGAGLYFNPLATVLGAGGLFGANKYKDKIKSSINKFKERVKKDMNTDYFEGPQDSKFVKNLKQKKVDKRQEAAKDKSYYTGGAIDDFSADESDFLDIGRSVGVYGTDIPTPYQQELAYQKEIDRTNQGWETLSRPTKDPYLIPEEIQAKRKRDISNMPYNPSILYSKKEAAAREALLNQNFGPLQSLIMQQQNPQTNVQPPAAQDITADMATEAPIEYYGTPTNNAMLYQLMQRSKAQPTNTGLDVLRNTPY